MQRSSIRGWRILATVGVCLGVPLAVLSCGADTTQLEGSERVLPTDSLEAQPTDSVEAQQPSVPGVDEPNNPVPDLDDPAPAPTLPCVGDEPWCEGDVAAPCTLRCEPRRNGCIAFSEFVPLGGPSDWNYYFTVDALGPDGQYVYWRHDYSGGALRTFPYRWRAPEGVLSLAGAWGVLETEHGRAPDDRELYGATLDVSDDGKAVVGRIFDDEQSASSISGVVSVTGEPLIHLDFLPLKVSSDARVVVGVRNDRALIWDAAGGTRPLAGGDLNAPPDSGYRGRVLLSNSGDVAVVNGADGALYWGRSRGVVPLVELLGISAEIHVSHVSDQGDVLFGGAGDGVDEPLKAFRWTEAGGLQWLGRLPDAPDASFFQFSHATPDGRVLIGSVGLPDRTSDGLFRWSTETGLERIAPTQRNAVRTYVSSSGDTVVGYYATDGGGTSGSFRWNRETGLNEVSGFNAKLIALDGDLIVDWNADEPSASKFGPALESEERLPIDIILSGLVPESWRAGRIENVSANGTAVVGIGTDPLGERQGWLVRVQERCP